MNKQHLYRAAPYLVLLTGFTGAALRRLMYRAFTDETGLLIPGNPVLVLSLLLAAGAVAVTLAAAGCIADSRPIRDKASPSLPGGLAAFAAAAGMAVLLAVRWAESSDRLGILWRGAGVAGSLCMAFTGWCRILGRRPAFWFHGIISLFFAVNLIHHYRLWSGVPQVADYAWQLIACVGLALTAYYRTALDAGMGSRRMALTAGLLSTYFCMVSAGDGPTGWFYLAAGIWSAIPPAGWTPRQEIREDMP